MVCICFWHSLPLVDDVSRKLLLKGNHRYGAAKGNSSQQKMLAPHSDSSYFFPSVIMVMVVLWFPRGDDVVYEWL